MQPAGKKATGSVPPSDPWFIREERFDAAGLAVQESLFALAGGYLGTRGTFEEPVAPGIKSIEGTYLNGVYFREPIHYDESAFGFATHNNKMVLVPNGKVITLAACGETFVHGASEVTDFSRSLDLRSGRLARTTRWNLTGGRSLDIRTERLVSLTRRGLMAITYSVTSFDYDGAVTLTSTLDAAYGGTDRGGDPRAGQLSITDCLTPMDSGTDANDSFFLHRIKDSETLVATAACHAVEGVGATITPAAKPHVEGQRFDLHLAPGQTVTLTKYVQYDHGPLAEAEALDTRTRNALAAAAKDGFDKLAAEQEAELATFWADAGIEINGAPDLAEALRFNMFHLYQSAGRNGMSSIAAKGLTGHGYDGHYFWDSEIYVVPFFTATRPAIARAMLEYRYRHLDQARARARTMAHKRGALFPWRTIGGEECSSYFPAGTAQYHINAAIAYATIQYIEVTGDMGFAAEMGAELLIETARLWLEAGHFSAHDGGRFCIHEVTGPDEYSAMADNNFYTNAMARHHLEGAVRVMGRLAKDAPDAYAALVTRLTFTSEELGEWSEAAAKMNLPYDMKLGIHAQDDTFLNRPVWDFDGTPADKYPLLLNFHPLTIYRHQVLKQADVVLAMVLLSDRFTMEEKRRNLAYYEPITTHDSTLSTCIYAVANAELGNREAAYKLFMETCRMDLDNLHGNTHYGVHAACMAGSWMGVAYGFAGLRFEHGTPAFRPSLPADWQDYRFAIRAHGCGLAVSVAPNGTTYELIDGESLTLRHFGKNHTIAAGKPLTLPNA
ncbi:glycoside hydrolase family 65 protein [Pseudokordiimonas caeni]|uniref:glycoside hydrolase family 65 protein n=1 Tax=Pseudokordiimonas caeni TaxID=2997908 RepID=UPI00281277B9|nr:glycosyl hydrolase family 65 protein [Pseudokordiimonas caeni]